MNVLELTKKAFAPDGTLSHVLKRRGITYHMRDAQVSYALATARSLSDHDDQRGQVACLEASTGVGKTLGYLIPALLRCAAGYRGVVSTFTLALQEQILTKDVSTALDVVFELTGKRPKVSGRIGRSNFISPERVQALANDLSESGSLSAAAAKQLEKLCETTGEIRRFTQKFGPLPKEIKPSDICLTPVCSPESSLVYDQHVDQSVDADLVIIPHALLMMDAIKWYKLLSNTEKPAFDFAICDEADQLTDAAESVFSKRTTLPMLKRLSSNAAAFGLKIPTFDKALNECADWLHYAASGSNSGAIKSQDNIQALPLVGYDQEEQRQEALTHATALKIGIEKLQRKLKNDNKFSDIAEYADEIQDGLRYFIEGCKVPGLNNIIPALVWSPIRKHGGLAIVPSHPGRLMGRYFSPIKDKEAFLNTLVCTSATLDAETVRGITFSGFRSDIGIFDAKDHKSFREDISTVFEPKKYGSMQINIASENCPHPTLRSGDVNKTYTTNPDWVGFCADVICGVKAGRTYVLCNSHHDTSLIANELEVRGKKGLLFQSKGQNLETLLVEYKANPNAILITAGGWEGVDLPGLVNNLVITRIPISPADPVKASINNYVSKYLGSEKKAASKTYAEQIRTARRKMTQGCGRGIRKEHDAVNLYICDPRFPKPDMSMNNTYKKFHSFITVIPRRFREGLFASFKQGRTTIIEPKTSKISA